MTEELGLSVGVDGFSNFERQMDAMDKSIEDTADAWDESGDAANDAAKGVDNVAKSYNEATAKSNKLKLVTLQLAQAQDVLGKETTDLGRAQAQVRVDSLTQQMQKLSTAEEAVVVDTKKVGLSLTDLKSGIDMAIGAAKTVARVFQQAFDLGEQGAQVRQAGQAIKTLGLNMDELRTAAGGTIDDMGLIASTSKLLAGTTGELNAAMRESAPQLLNVARAAVKLDPTIGSVAFVYESLAAGIKKNQPLLIDNANITVKVSTAQENLAKSLNKTVGELTDTEKSTALLYATLEGGATLIDQVGGSVDSATDAYSRFTAQSKNLTDSLKAQWSEGLSPLISGMADNLQIQNMLNEGTITYADAIDQAAMASSSGTVVYKDLAVIQEELAEKQRQTNATIQLYNDFADIATRQTIDLGEGVDNSQESFDQYNQAIIDSDAALSDYYTSQQAANDAAIAAQTAFNNAAAALGELSKASFVKTQIDALRESINETTFTTEDFVIAEQALLEQSGLLTEAEKETQASIDALNKSFIDGKIEAPEFATAILLLKASVDSLEDKTITIGVEYNIPAMPGLLDKGPGQAQAFASGGTLSGGSIIAGEYGPEMITGLNAGSRVLSSPATRSAMARGGDTTNNYNLTTNSITRPGGLSLEFDSMGMAAP